jgi:hypothetical protein
MAGRRKLVKTPPFPRFAAFFLKNGQTKPCASNAGRGEPRAAPRRLRWCPPRSEKSRDAEIGAGMPIELVFACGEHDRAARSAEVASVAREPLGRDPYPSQALAFHSIALPQEDRIPPQVERPGGISLTQPPAQAGIEILP